MNEAQEREFIDSFKAGVTVRYAHDRNYLGVVCEHQAEDKEIVNDEDLVTVKWADGSCVLEDIWELRVVDAENDLLIAEQLQAKIRETEAAFETAFKAWQDVQSLAEKDSDLYTLRSSGLIDLSKLEDIINTGGWSTSSMYC